MTNDSTPPSLVARDDELTALRHRLLQVGELGPGLVVVTGPSGMGSSALVRRLAADHRAAGGRCLQARAVPWESEIAYGVLSQLLGRPPPETDVLAVAARLVDGARRGRSRPH